MWSRIRRRVLKSRSYEPQPTAALRDLEEDSDDANSEGSDKPTDAPSSSDGISRRVASGLTKCLITNLNGNPISCACKRNVSPVDTPVPDDRAAVKGKDGEKSNSLTIGSSLNYYFKETDSCEVVRKNKPAASAPKAKSAGEASGGHAAGRKTDGGQTARPAKDKHQAASLFSAGQREAKGGLDFNEFHRVFENSQESLVETGKTVTFETFGKPVPTTPDVKPPLFLPVKKKKKPVEDSLDPVDGSLLSSSKGASLTSEEGVESGYGTQDDGNDRLARSVSSSSESNAPDFIADFGKARCPISRDSTGEEDVFHHASDGQKDKIGGHNKLFPTATKSHTENKHNVHSQVGHNTNIVVAEVHAENFDEPHVCGFRDLAMKQTASGWKPKTTCPKVDNKYNDNQNSNLTLTEHFDINCNPAGDDATRSKNSHNDNMQHIAGDQSPAENRKALKSSTRKTSAITDSDSDDDIKEYLPADSSSMSEVYKGSSLDGKGNGVHASADLYASVPKPPETEHVMQIMTSPPTHTVILSKDTTNKAVSRLNEKRSSRPDLIDCHDRTPLTAAKHEAKTTVNCEEGKNQSESSEENVVISDDGDSGPPLPVRNYNQTMTRDKSIGSIQKICEAPTLIIRQKSTDTAVSSVSSTQSAAPVGGEAQQSVVDDEIVQQDEPIHMSWDEVMKEAKSLGIPLNPPTSAQAIENRRCSSSSQSSSCTPVASPVVKRTTKVKRSQSECKKRSPFKDRLQSLFTLRRSKGDANKLASSEEQGRRSAPPMSYERACSTMSPEYTIHKVKSCTCRSEAQRVANPCQYTCYTRHNKHRCGTRHRTPPHQPHHHMNVSINVSVISSNFGGSPNSPEVSIMTQSMDASLGDAGSPSICPSSPMSQSLIDAACYPGSPGVDGTLCPGSPLSRSLMSTQSVSNQSLSHQSIMSGQSAPSYYSSHSASGQSPSTYQSSLSTGGQSAHSYHSAHSLGSPTTLPPCSTPGKGGATSPLKSSPLNGLANNYGINGTITKNGCYGDSYDNGYNGANEGGSNADFISSLLKLKDCGWYWGPLGWDEAENKLANKADGSFLVRDSSDDRYILSLSFRSQGTTHHTRIEHYKGMFSFYSQPKSHGAATIVEFIEKAMEHSRSGKFLYFLRPRAPGLPPAPVQLLYPVSRLLNMQSLQHMCRFVILKQVRKDHIDRLPIPPRLKEYLKQNQYYTEYLGGELADFARY